MADIEITFIGQDGTEAFVRFNDSPDKPYCIYIKETTFKSIPLTKWNRGAKTGYLYSSEPIMTLKEIEMLGFEPHGEEKVWFETGQWDKVA